MRIIGCTRRMKVMEDRSEYFLSVIESHKGILYKVVTAYCKKEEDRKDLLQMIMLQLWKSFDRYDDQYRYSTWIYRISLNVAISYYRKENRRKRVIDSMTEDLLTISEENTLMVYEDEMVHLTQFIARLKSFDKALILLYLEEKSHKEIAGIMGITETNVATKINRIKTILKHKFLPY